MEANYGTKDIQALHYAIWPWRRILNGACISISNLPENIAWQTHKDDLRPEVRGPSRAGPGAIAPLATLKWRLWWSVIVSEKLTRKQNKIIMITKLTCFSLTLPCTITFPLPVHLLPPWFMNGARMVLRSRWFQGTCWWGIQIIITDVIRHCTRLR
jgi:hypothetical protein